MSDSDVDMMMDDELAERLLEAIGDRLDEFIETKKEHGSDEEQGPEDGEGLQVEGHIGKDLRASLAGRGQPTQSPSCVDSAASSSGLLNGADAAAGVGSDTQDISPGQAEPRCVEEDTQITQIDGELEEVAGGVDGMWADFKKYFSTSFYIIPPPTDPLRWRDWSYA